MSNYVADELMASGLQVGQVVGILTSRSIEMIIAMLAILKAGGCFTVIDSIITIRTYSVYFGNFCL